MGDYKYFIFARALHVISVVIWIGGVSFVTLVLLPALNNIIDSEKKLELFEQLEGKFAFYARIFTLLTGFSGFFMLEFLHAWHHYGDLHFWWLHLMTFVWLLFIIVLFILEPLFLHHWFHEQAKKNSNRTFRIITFLHIFVLILSLLAVFFAVAGCLFMLSFILAKGYFD